MRKNNEFLTLLCNLYLVGMTAFLPLYTGGTYSQLGDTKYILFRNLSGLCLGIWLIISAAEAVKEAWRRGFPGILQGVKKTKTEGVSATDIFALLYGGLVLLSALCSRYEGTPWTGYREWYMGAVSQLMFVGIYFFVSRCYDGKRYPLLLWTGSFFLVVVLGILHRLGIDPLGLMQDFNPKDWTYSHMLSTIGNINWFCGYSSVALALPITFFLKSESRWMRIALYFVSVAGLFLLFVQGSDIGVIMAAVCLLVCLLWGLGDGKVFRRTLLLTAGLSFLLPSYGCLADFLGESALEALPADSIGWNVIKSSVWWAVGAGAFGFWFLLRLLCRRKRDKAVKYLQRAAVVSLFLALVAGTALFLMYQPSGEMWGNGRGVLWKIAAQGFWRSSFLQKLIGAGPDCFAEYIYSTYTGDEFLLLEGRWAGAVYANAHNEWLNHLVNLGIMGTGFYMGIFASAAVRYRRYLPGVLALALYGAVSLTGFQQCISTPLLFLILGMCESGLRRDFCGEADKAGNTQEGGNERKDGKAWYRDEMDEI